MNGILRKIVQNVSRTCQQQRRHASKYPVACLKEPGKPLVIEEREQGALKPTQVRVQVVYCSVNSVDYQKFKTSKLEGPFIPGYELSGEVLEVGSEVKREEVMVGSRVVGLSLEQFGGLAGECVLDKDDVWIIPGELERKDAAVIAYGHSTALYAFSKLSPLKEKEKVVVSVGPAGLGLAAVDVASNIYQASCIGVVDDENLGDVIRSKGAFTTVHFNKKLTKNILKATEGKGASVVYDAVGEEMLQPLGTCVRIGGKILHAAPIFYDTLPAPIPHTFQTIVSLKVLRQQNKELYKTLVSDTLEFADEGVISGHISAKFPFNEVNSALEFIEQKKCTGKVLIYIDS